MQVTVTTLRGRSMTSNPFWRMADWERHGFNVWNPCHVYWYDLRSMDDLLLIFLDLHS